jgi:serine/threonine protein kinase/Tol biopolymer transport system component
MPLDAGARLGPYEVVAAIGAGGMGEVYKARDTRLDRTVAIKILPAALAEDPQFRDRFDREARAISQLDHPNICTLHDVGEQHGTAYLVMQYLEGETLEARLKKGALPLDQALAIAIQVASALATAHRAGIIHRDLKPGNIMLTKSGARLLDFGLAKATGVGVAAGLSMLPTTPAGLTAQGTILGTLQYMAPEQLEGHEADARTDIFAFGTVVYEMMTGRKAFQGSSQASLISAIMSAEPPLAATLQPLTPPVLEHVLARCLEKKPEDRWQSAHDVMKELQWIAAGGASSGAIAMPTPGHRLGRSTLVAAGLIVGLVLASAYVSWHTPAPKDAPQTKFTIPTPELASPAGLSLSPDGQHLVFIARSSPSAMSLYVRSMDAVEPHLLTGTEGAAFPFWSPDSQHVGFVANGMIKRVEVGGGPPRTICAAPTAVGASWNSDGTIVFGNYPGVVKRVSASGGEPSDVTALSGKEIGHAFPFFLPDGSHFLFTAVETTSPQFLPTLRAGSLDSKTSTLVVRALSNFVYAAPGYLLYHREGALFAQPFSVKRLTLEGEPHQIADDVAIESNGIFGDFAVSSAGSLVYHSVTSAGLSQLVWYDRTGRRLAAVGTPAQYRGIALSSDNKRIAVHLHEQTTGGDIWLLDVDRGTLTRLTTDRSHHITPMWSRDGAAVVFAANRDDGIFGFYRQPSNGIGNDELLLKSKLSAFPEDYAPNGQFIAYSQASSPTAFNVNVLPLMGDRKPQNVTNGTEFLQGLSKISADGHWFAYISNETRRFEVYVQQYPERTNKVQISTNGGLYPRWSSNSKELFYLSQDGTLMVVDVRENTANFQASTPRMLFKTTAVLTDHFGFHYEYDVTTDGQRFLVNEPVTPANQPSPLTVVLNWQAALKR